jgi:hypothetical protein
MTPHTYVPSLPTGTSPARAGLVSRALASRWAVLVTTLFYAWAIGYAHSEYLAYDWGYYGFTYRPLGFEEIALIVVFVSIGALGIPSTLKRPSSIILLLLHLLVLVPTVVISLGLNTDRIDRYGLSLGAMSLAFLLAGKLAQRPQARTRARPPAMPGDFFTGSFVAVFLVATVILVAAYRSIMTFAGLEDIYQQRLAAADDNVVLAYLRTYYASVISPGVLALGLLKSRFSLAVLGVLGCLITYMIDAQKTAFLLPFVIVLAFFALRNRMGATQATSSAIAGLALLVTITVSLHQTSDIARFLNTFLVFRTIAIPGLTFPQYSDLFSSLGHTWWSNVTGLSLVVPAPAAFVNHPDWPALGRIVGDYYYGFGSQNANANLFSGEGVAAAGAFGVLVIGLIWAAWLRLIDRVSEGWDPLFALLVLVPVGISLANGHLSTVMLSFGGGFWTVLLWWYKPDIQTRRYPRHELTRSST